MRNKRYGKLEFKVTQFVKKIYDKEGSVVGEEVNNYVSCRLPQLHRLMAKMVGWTSANVSTKMQHGIIPGTVYMQSFYNCRQEVFEEMYEILVKTKANHGSQKKRMFHANEELVNLQRRRVKKYGALGE